MSPIILWSVIFFWSYHYFSKCYIFLIALNPTKRSFSNSVFQFRNRNKNFWFDRLIAKTDLSWKHIRSGNIHNVHFILFIYFIFHLHFTIESLLLANKIPRKYCFTVLSVKSSWLASLFIRQKLFIYVCSLLVYTSSD